MTLYFMGTFNQTLLMSQQGLLNCEIGRLECRIITTLFKHMFPLYTEQNKFYFKRVHST
mgnify:FL=1